MGGGCGCSLLAEVGPTETRLPSAERVIRPRSLVLTPPTPDKAGKRDLAWLRRESGVLRSSLVCH